MDEIVSKNIGNYEYMVSCDLLGMENWKNFIPTENAKKRNDSSLNVQIRIKYDMPIKFINIPISLKKSDDC